MRPGMCLDIMEQIKISAPAGNWNLDCPACSLVSIVTVVTELFWFQVSVFEKNHARTQLAYISIYLCHTTGSIFCHVLSMTALTEASSDYTRNLHLPGVWILFFL
jgi:hypothetical protein